MDEQTAKRATSKRPADDQQTTTKQECNNLIIKKCNIPYQEIIDSFNFKLNKLPSVRQVTDKRKKAIKQIWDMNNDYANLNFYENFYKRITRKYESSISY